MLRTGKPSKLEYKSAFLYLASFQPMRYVSLISGMRCGASFTETNAERPQTIRTLPQRQELILQILRQRGSIMANYLQILTKYTNKTDKMHVEKHQEHNFIRKINEPAVITSQRAGEWGLRGVCQAGWGG